MKTANMGILENAIVERSASHQQALKMISHVVEFVRSLKAAMALGSIQGHDNLR